MRFLLFYFGVFGLLTLTVSGVIFSQSVENPSVSKSISENDVDFKVKLEKKDYRIDEKIEVEILLENNLNFAIDLPYRNTDLLAGYRIEVKNAEGKLIEPAKPTDFGRGFGSRMSWYISAGKEDKRIFTLNDYYELSAGTYSLNVFRKINSTITNDSFLVKSEKIEFKVK